MSTSLQPRHGVRILLERDGEPPGGASAPPGTPTYRGSIFAGELRSDFSVTFDLAGQPLITPGEHAGEAPAAALKMLAGIARIVARHALAATPPEWPRRVLRWRKLDC